MKCFAPHCHTALRPQHTIALWLALALLLNIAPLAPALAESTGTLTARVVLRKDADKESKALQTLPEGDEVTVLETADSWYRVRYGTYSGYIMAAGILLHLIWHWNWIRSVKKIFAKKS